MVQREPFNRRLRRLIDDRRMEPKELARLTGLSASYIRVLLSNAGRYPSLKTAESIADVLNVSVGELTGGDEEARQLRELRLAKETYERATRATIEVGVLENNPTLPTPTVTPGRSGVEVGTRIDVRVEPSHEQLLGLWSLLNRKLPPDEMTALMDEVVESLEGTEQEDR